MKLHIKLFSLCGLILLVMDGYAQQASYREFKNIYYSTDDPENVLDAYIPNEYDQAKVIVYLHGSGWTGGDKDELPTPLIEELVSKRKYIVVSANYRLVKDGKNTFPAQMEDLDKLFKFLKANAGKYHFNGNEFALMGGSAGGHLAMLYAYGYDPAKQIKTVVDFWGPTDLTDRKVREDNPAGNAKISTLLGTADPNARICFDASPYFRLTKDTGVPTIIFHGGKDPLVPVAQAEKLYQKLQLLKIPSQYEYYPNEQHGMKGAAAFDVLFKTLAWLEKYYPENGS
nr:alpha/beta hydrolase [Pedobacter sp. ASV19]